MYYLASTGYKNLTDLLSKRTRSFIFYSKSDVEMSRLGQREGRMKGDASQFPARGPSWPTPAEIGCGGCAEAHRLQQGPNIPGGNVAEWSPSIPDHPCDPYSVIRVKVLCPLLGQ